MPELDGIAVCEALRLESQVPILFLSSRDEELDRVAGLEAGADDYIGKPFSPRELVARVRANLRRQTSVVPSVLQNAGYAIDLDTYSAAWDGEKLDLTRAEFHLLGTLVNKPGHVFDRDELMKHAYDKRRIVSYRTIDSHIRRLRDKLNQVGAPGITTVHGIGFKLQLD